MKTITKKRNKNITSWRPIIRTKNETADGLRAKNKSLPLFKHKTVVRLGSTTENDEIFGKNIPTNLVEINTVESVKTSRSKLLMKQAFDQSAVKSAEWFTFFNNEKGDLCITQNQQNKAVSYDQLPFPLIVKRIFGQKGIGMKKIDNKNDLTTFIDDIIIGEGGKTRYYLESFYNYNREYRLHVTKNGCFYTCRKLLKSNTPVQNRFYRNDSNCTWILEENPLFDKPVNWKACVAESVKALTACGLDIGAVDLRIQSSENKDGEKRENPDFIILEVNSAPAFGEITEVKYKEALTNLIKEKTKE